MKQLVRAVYENGVLKPLEPLDLTDQQQVYLSIEVVESDATEDELQAWLTVYEGLSAEEISEVEAIALDRTQFMKSP